MPDQRAGPGRAVRRHKPKTKLHALRVDAEPLRLRGVHKFVIEEFVRAAEIAWGQASERLRPNGQSSDEYPLIVLCLPHPLLDPRTVTATIGEDGRLGTVEATTPAALQAALAKHLSQRLGNA